MLNINTNDICVYVADCTGYYFGNYQGGMMKPLGVEFYKNFLYIENPLPFEVDLKKEGLKSDELRTVDYIRVAKCSGRLMIEDNELGQCHRAENCKPYLTLPEDLTDEEWLFVFGVNENTHYIDNGYYQDGDFYCMVRDCDNFNIINEYKPHIFKQKNGFAICNQELLNRMYSIHSHPKAKEYIENGIAIDKKVLE